MTDFPCFPPCSKCVNAGSCETPDVLTPAPKPAYSHFDEWWERRTPETSQLQLVMIERERAKYIELKCGHLTTWDVQELYVAWRPKGKKYHLYCENCAKWVTEKPKSRHNDSLPPEPMF